MNKILNTLRKKNPDIDILPVTDERFKYYGRVLGGRDEALSAALSATEIPAEGNLYRASVESLESVPVIADIRRVAFGEMETQAGFCNGRGYTLNALEYHKCSEVNETTTAILLVNMLGVCSLLAHYSTTIFLYRPNVISLPRLTVMFHSFAVSPLTLIAPASISLRTSPYPAVKPLLQSSVAKILSLIILPHIRI